MPEEQGNTESPRWRENVRQALDPRYGEAPPPLTFSGFREVLRRAGARALRTGLFTRKHNFFVQATRSALFDPNRGAIDSLNGTVRNLRVENQAEPAGEWVLTDVDDLTLFDFQHGARQTWLLAVVVCLAGLICFDIAAAAAHRSAWNYALTGLALLAFGITTILRSARDHEVFRTRQTLPVKAFLRRLRQLWCPYPSASTPRQLIEALALPAAAAMLLCVPATLLVRALS